MKTYSKDIILAVKPKYVELIKSGVKTIELRKSAPTCPVDRIYIYETAPVSKVVGYFRGSDVIGFDPRKLN